MDLTQAEVGLLIGLLRRNGVDVFASAGGDIRGRHYSGNGAEADSDGQATADLIAKLRRASLAPDIGVRPRATVGPTLSRKVP